jgi:hypothetical protein
MWVFVYPEFSSRVDPCHSVIIYLSIYDLQQATELYVIFLYYCIIFINCGLTLTVFFISFILEYGMESF